MAYRRKNKVNKTLTGEIWGIVVISISVLIGLSIYYTPLGVFGILIKKFFMGLFGIGAYVLPFLTLIIGLAMLLNNGRINLKGKFLFICLSIYDLIILFHVRYAVERKGMTIIDRLLTAYEEGKNLKGGGILSELISIPFIFALGKIGAYIILTCLLIICLIFITNISLGEIISSLIKRIKEKLSNAKKDKIEIEGIKVKEIDEPTEDKDNVSIIPPTIPEKIDKVDKKIKIMDFVNLDEKDTDKDTEKDKEIKVIDSQMEDNVKHQKRGEYIFPPITLLDENKTKVNVQDKRELLNNAKILEDTLLSFGVEAKVIQVSRGPAVTRYELHPNPGVKVSKIVNLSDDIALNLAAPTVRIEAPIPGKAAVGIEVPNKEVAPVTLREIIESPEFIEFGSKVAFPLGKDISGKCSVADISKMPHLLIAGATGSGKSVCINTLITGLIYKSSPEDVRMLMIDPKVVELSVYNGIPHLLIPVVTDPKKAASALFWAVNEMEERYRLFAKNNVRNIDSYNSQMEKDNPSLKLPKVVIIIDELSDLMMAAPNDVEDAICRLAQMARAAGMHLVIATQRPSVDVITGLIKANIPSRISFAVSSQIDSRTILDMSGAEKLLGRGDMLFLPTGDNKPTRVQGAYISEKEVERIVDYLKKANVMEYNEDIIEKIENPVIKEDEKDEEEVDILFKEAIKTAVDYGQVSASMLQRRLRIGFNRAARLVEDMESRGLIGPQDGSKPRQVLISKEDIEDYIQ